MKIQVEKMHSVSLLLLIFVNIFQSCLTELIFENSCDVDDEAALQWYEEVFNCIKTNQNTSHHLVDINEKIRNVELKLEKIATEQSQMLQSATMDQLNNLNKKLSDKIDQLTDQNYKLNAKIDELEQKTYGDIVIQRRMDGSVDFYRTWAEYKAGFGNSSGEFFIGLEQLHKLTNSRHYELLIALEDWENERRYAKYDQFIVGSEKEKYPIKKLGNYTGSAGDSLTKPHLGHKFTTKDADNDESTGSNCAVQYSGAWWYAKCHNSNLNGIYLKSELTADQSGKGVTWHDFKNTSRYSFKFVEMYLHPK